MFSCSLWILLTDYRIAYLELWWVISDRLDSVVFIFVLSIHHVMSMVFFFFSCDIILIKSFFALNVLFSLIVFCGVNHYVALGQVCGLYTDIGALFNLVGFFFF